MATPGAAVRDLGVGVGVGTFSGAFGVGGGILLVPYLVLRREVPQKTAQATSLVMVAMAASSGALTYAVRDSIAWWPAIVILVGGLAGAMVGAVVVQRTEDRRLRALFGLLLVVAGLRLLWPTGDVTAGELPAPTVLVAGAYVLSGLGMGLLSALFGIGGGILLVPVLIAGFGYAPQLAAGTSLTVMVPIALLGAVRLTRPGLTQWGDGARYGLGAIAGAVLGAALALAASGTLLRVAFAILMLAVGAHLTWSAVRAQPPLEEDAP